MPRNRHHLVRIGKTECKSGGLALSVSGRPSLLSGPRSRNSTVVLTIVSWARGIDAFTRNPPAVGMLAPPIHRLGGMVLLGSVLIRSPRRENPSIGHAGLENERGREIHTERP